MNRTTKIFIKIAALWLFIISAILTPGSAQYIRDWHKPTPCFGCHEETLGAPYGSEECGNCHYYFLDVPKLQEEHNPKICRSCHIGNTMVEGSDKQIFHSGHSAVSCTRCHTEDNFTVIKIESKGFECVSCHGNQVHSIHIKNLGRACPICHGSWAEGRNYKAENTSPIPGKEQGKSVLENFTIFNFLKDLFYAIFGIGR
ncbi:MAG: hypothetical protein M5U10_01960 [Candidatus Methanoperedens sp.]|uniref:hypothetical protein n=1 Tax=Candidatus Methanoperedens nitratireducens TaxID=1392998 RepID=UPI00064E7F39|nr:hypothetical protein [Candidatus Methanoperedens nitroreducens]MDJ1420657.1 hypothetical protein [Candidatus Methanoperedens sp.]